MQQEGVNKGRIKRSLNHSIKKFERHISWREWEKGRPYIHNNHTKHNDSLHEDAQHNDSQHEDTQHNDSQHEDTQHNNSLHEDTHHNFKMCVYECLSLAQEA